MDGNGNEAAGMPDGESTVKKKSRRDMTLAEKITYLDKIREQPSNTSQRRLVEITGLAKTTIARLKRQENVLREEWALCDGRRGSCQKRKREGKDPDVDEALSEWFAIVSGRGLRVQGPMLMCKAEELAKKLGRVNFKATCGWLSRWKSRHDVKFKKASLEKDVANRGCVEQWKSTKLTGLLEQFTTDGIYFANETGLYYRATPDGSLCYEHSALSDSDKALDRVTVLCCSNMSGTDKRKLLVIGKNAYPRCFKGLRMDSLPVVYRANRNVWMTSELFKEWLLDWDRELQPQLRTVLLLLEDCVAHPRLDCLKNIQLEFLPPKASVHPMEMGVIKNLKTFYRARLVNYILEAIEEGLLTPSSPAGEVSAKVNILQAVTFVADSWRKITSETIQTCFADCGFTRVMLGAISVDNEDDDGNVGLERVDNHEEFVSIDQELQCYDESDDYDTAIVARITEKHMSASEDRESDDDDDDPNALVQVTTQDARKCIETLRRYFMQEGNEGSPIAVLDVCGDFVQVQSDKRTRQLTLDKFFKR